MISLKTPINTITEFQSCTFVGVIGLKCSVGDEVSTNAHIASLCIVLRPVEAHRVAGAAGLAGPGEAAAPRRPVGRTACTPSIGYTFYRQPSMMAVSVRHRRKRPNFMLVQELMIGWKECLFIYSDEDSIFNDRNLRRTPPGFTKTEENTSCYTLTNLDVISRTLAGQQRVVSLYCCFD